MSTSWPASALVIGLAIHGLSIARSLSSAGIRVDILASKPVRRTAPFFTRYAQVHTAQNVNSDDLIEHLTHFSSKIPGSKPIVVFPTSDRMVRAIAAHWESVPERFRLSWAHCRELVAHLQQKTTLPELAKRQGILHPRTSVLRDAEESGTCILDLEPPLIVKPSHPLSGFKASVVHNAKQLQELAITHRSSLPFVVQEFIEGETNGLLSCTMYLERGAVVGSFTSRKIAASPPGTGQGTVFIADDVPDVARLARRLFCDMDLTGPVAVEFMRDHRGQYWMIEPNIGRTEYCVNLAIQSGFHLPLVEYRSALGLTPDPNLSQPQSRGIAWFDTDKDPLCYVRHRNRALRASGTTRINAVFPYHGGRDPVPWLVSTTEQALTLFKSSLRHLRGIPLH